MTKETLPYTFSVKGGRHWYFRSKQTGVIPLRGQPGTADFHRAYAAALKMREGKLAARRPDGSFAWLVDAYLKSAEYRALADATQSDYAKTLALIEEEMGEEPYRYTTKAMLKVVRDDYADTPRKAHKIKQMVSRLYSWADENSLVPEGFNPAASLKRLKRKGGDKEYVPWSDPEIDWYMGAAAMHALVPVMIALYTGQRRRDVRTMRWNQWQGDLIRVRTSKTHQLIDMPCHPVLKRFFEELRTSLGAIPFHTAPICLNEEGKPFASDDAMSGVVRRVVEKIAQMENNRSLHGLRYAAAGRMEEGGATIGQIKEVLGHHTFEMAMKYATARRRAAGGIAAMGAQDG
jgi:integrase